MPIINGDNNDNVLYDTSGDDVLNGMGGHDVLNISLGEDEANGGTGGDSLIVDWRTAVNAVLTLAGPTAGVDGLGGTYSDGSGTRQVIYTGIERFEIMTGSGNDDIVTGGSHDIVHTGDGADTIVSGGGNDTLIGGAGIDSMTGGAGNDTYYLDNAGDTLDEDAGEGRDTAYTAVSYVLAAGVHLEVLSAASIWSLHFLDLTGNELDNELVGNLGDNVLDGGGGHDVLLGNNGLDTLIGGGGNDTLDGGADVDDMTGGEGDDTYFVDESSDIVTEAADEGRDLVYTTVSFALTAGNSIEVLSAASIAETDAIDLTGNEIANELIGNSGANRLESGGGDDTLYGHGGNDVLIGGAGADVMFGGFGDDSFHLDSSADTVREIVGQGRDAVYVGFSYTLPLGQIASNGFIEEHLSIEILSTSFLAGTAAIDLTGNREDNGIYGNEGANVLNGDWGNDTLVGLGGDDTLIGSEGNDSLDGGTGVDSMTGGGGSDVFFVDNVGDVVVETDASGRDVVYSSVDYTLAPNGRIEVLSAASVGGTAPLHLTGNNRDNEIVGNAGDNVLNGGGDHDQLSGFGGADRFEFTTALGATNIDRLVDFVSGTDEIALDNAVFTGLPDGPLSSDAFRAGAAAQDADDRIIYDSATGRLFFDVDGMGGTAQVQFAIVLPGTIVAASDFTVI